MRASQRRLVRAQRDLSRKQPGSRNRAKSRRRLQRRHVRVRRQRVDHLHKITTHLARTKPVIVIEDLAVGGMLKSRRFSRSLADQSFGLLRRQLEYKCRASGARLLLAPRFFPSSKRCSRCGWIWAEMALKEREFRCQNPRLWRSPRPRPQRGPKPEVVGRTVLHRRSRRREGGDPKRLWSQGKTRPRPPTWRRRAPAGKQEPSIATSRWRRSLGLKPRRMGHEPAPRTTRMVT